MRVIIANDHGAVALKIRLMRHMEQKGFSVVNLGTDDENSVDYPDMARQACAEFLKGGYDFGVLLCGTGIGISIAANKIDGIRAALPQNKFAARMAKEHNNANFLVFGGRIDYNEPPEELLDAFVNATFDTQGRHCRRVAKLSPQTANGDFKHLVLWQLNTQLSPEEKQTAAAEVKKRLEALNGQIPGLKTLSVHILLGTASDDDLLLESVFDNEAALAAYQVHPKHLEAAAYVRSVTQARRCADFSFRGKSNESI